MHTPDPNPDLKYTLQSILEPNRNNVKEVLSLIVDTIEAVSKNYNQEAAKNIIALRSKINELDP